MDDTHTKIIQKVCRVEFVRSILNRRQRKSPDEKDILLPEREKFVNECCAPSLAQPIRLLSKQPKAFL